MLKRKTKNKKKLSLPLPTPRLFPEANSVTIFWYYHLFRVKYKHAYYSLTFDSYIIDFTVFILKFLSPLIEIQNLLKSTKSWLLQKG